ncbi:hypothetical protein M422DRAFT_261841 [Sphaerobolus stellatus SS14]|uniref:Uncharacterized protein n=1 Tax=Sphaerobolus stellatus (strain SS14) TaxID=990650 RepID=A0A0C9VEQ5_SPHS4|nr:hypothetical protein M422DRAFT_261841 [Sphaerobolus stellatus SS14]
MYIGTNSSNWQKLNKLKQLRLLELSIEGTDILPLETVNYYGPSSSKSITRVTLELWYFHPPLFTCLRSIFPNAQFLTVFGRTHRDTGERIFLQEDLIKFFSSFKSLKSLMWNISPISPSTDLPSQEQDAQRIQFMSNLAKSLSNLEVIHVESPDGLKTYPIKHGARAEDIFRNCNWSQAEDVADHLLEL